MSTYLDELHNLVTKLEEEGHHLAERFRTAWNALVGDAAQLAAHAKDDAQQVATDATPVVHEAEQDAAELGAEVVQDAKDLATPAAPAPAAEPATEPAPPAA